MFQVLKNKDLIDFIQNNLNDLENISNGKNLSLKAKRKLNIFAWDAFLNPFIFDDYFGEICILTQLNLWEEIEIKDKFLNFNDQISGKFQNWMYQKEQTVIFSGTRLIPKAAHFIAREIIYDFAHIHCYEIKNAQFESYLILKGQTNFYNDL